MTENTGDLIEFDCDMIVQQCNCLTTTSHGLSRTIAQRTGVNIYRERKRSQHSQNVATRETQGKPGSVVVRAWRKNSQNRPLVACLLGQFGPGKPGYRGKGGKFGNECKKQRVDDTFSNREAWFRASLTSLRAYLSDPQGEGVSVKSVAFPWQIGCGLAGGNWKRYRRMIIAFQAAVSDIGVQVTVVKLPSEVNKGEQGK